MAMSFLSHDPQGLWRYFFSLTRLPHPSGYEDEVRNFLLDFASTLGLETHVDAVGNVLIRKRPSPGMEKRIGVVLQAHLDMVPQAAPGVVHDFLRDPIETFVEGDWLYAKGTTLGADNGIGVAAAMEVLASDSLRHGPLEVLLTVNEEAGMSGAFGLKPDMLNGRLLLNLDSEEEGCLFVGCAGGLDATITFSCPVMCPPSDCRAFRLSVSGLKGGHSGMDIHLGLGNANKILNRLLHQGFSHHGMRLSSLCGGSLRNAIPRDASAIVVVPSLHAEAFVDGIATLAEQLRYDYLAVDPALAIECSSVTRPQFLMDDDCVGRLLDAIGACPDGVVRISSKMQGLVETSMNLAVVSSSPDSVVLGCLMRSSSYDGMCDLSVKLENLFPRFGGTVKFSNGYPGWDSDPSSPILALMRDVYRELFSEDPEVKSVHAGLECGIIGAAYPQVEMVSFGPTICHPHSPKEKVYIPSVGKFWEFLIAILERVP